MSRCSPEIGARPVSQYGATTCRKEVSIDLAAEWPRHGVTITERRVTVAEFHRRCSEEIAAPVALEIDMRKYAGELRVGDIWTEHPQHGVARRYRVIAIAPGLASTIIRVTGERVFTRQRRTMDFFRVNRVEVREEPT